jgi:long-chain acyl-CoA synthetase
MDLLFNSFPFARQETENIRQGLEHMGSLLDRGWSVVVYPEGRMSERGTLLPLKRGTGLIATEMNVPVVPVNIQGTNVILPYGKLLPRRRGTVHIAFGAPMHFKHSDSAMDATSAIQKAFTILSSVATHD